MWDGVEPVIIAIIAPARQLNQNRHAHFIFEKRDNFFMDENLGSQIKRQAVVSSVLQTKPWISDGSTHLVGILHFQRNNQDWREV